MENDMYDLAEIFGDGGPPQVGGYSCLASGCDEPVKRLAELCAGCQAKANEAEHAKDLERLWNHWIDQDQRPAAFGSRLLDRIVLDKAALAESEKLAAERVNGIVTFCGPAGGGKTTLAVALLRAWVDIGRPWRGRDNLADRKMSRGARFFKIPQITESQWRPTASDEDMTLINAYGAPMAVLDEVGRDKDHKGGIFSLIDSRFSNRMPTIITTPHLTRETFFAATGDGGLTRRVFDDATVITVRNLNVGR